MPYNGAGLYSPPAADFPAVSNTLIQATKFNNTVNDIATALSTAITKDGQTTVTANIPFSGFYATNVGIKAIAGAVGTPGIAWNAEPSSGWYRIAANDYGLSIAGVLKQETTATAFTLSQNALFSADNTYDIGAAGATRPRDFFLGRNATVTGTLGVTGTSTLGVTNTGALGVTGLVTVSAGVKSTGVTNTVPSFQAILAANATAIAFQAGTGTSYGWKWIQDEVTTGDMSIVRRVADVDSTVLSIARATGIISLAPGGFEQVRIINTASATRYITLAGSNGANPTISTSAGSLAVGVDLQGSTVTFSGMATVGGLSTSNDQSRTVQIGRYSGASFSYIEPAATSSGLIMRGATSGADTLMLNSTGATVTGTLIVTGATTLSNGGGITLVGGAAAGSTSDLLVVGPTNATTGTDRKVIRLGAGGYSDPAAYNTDANGDKINLFGGGASAAFDARIGVGTASDIWYKSSGSTAGAGIHRFFTGSTPSEQVRISGGVATRYITLTGSNGANPTIGVSAGRLGFGTHMEGAIDANIFLNSATASKALRCSGSTFEIVNSAYAAVIFAVSDVGAVTVYGAMVYGGVTLSAAVTGTGNMVLSASPTFTGVVALAVGAVGAPALHFGDATSGFFRPGANIIALSISGVEAFRVNAVNAFKASDNGTYNSATSAVHEFRKGVDDALPGLWIEAFSATAANQNCLKLRNTLDANGTTSYFFQGTGNATERITGRTNGGLANFSANNVNLSTRLSKESFEAFEQDWNKVRGIRASIQYFKYQDATNKGDEASWCCSPMAEDVQKHFPEYVVPFNDAGQLGVREQPLLWELTANIIDEVESLRSRMQVVEAKLSTH